MHTITTPVKHAARFLTVILCLCALQSPAFAENPNGYVSEYTRASLTTDVESIQPGQSFKVFLEFDLAEGWYTYSDPPGDSGLPASIQWTLPPGFEAGPIEWPKPETYEAHGFVTYGYSGKSALPVTVTPPAHALPEPQTLKASVSWLICNEICIPESAALSLLLPASTENGGPQ